MSYVYSTLAQFFSRILYLSSSVFSAKSVRPMTGSGPRVSAESKPNCSATDGAQAERNATGMQRRGESRRRRISNVARAVAVLRTVDFGKSCLAVARAAASEGGVVMPARTMPRRRGGNTLHRTAGTPSIPYRQTGARFLEGVGQMCYAPTSIGTGVSGGGAAREFIASVQRIKSVASGVAGPELGRRHGRDLSDRC